MTHPKKVPEEALASHIPAYSHPEWRRRFPWIVQGTTARGARDTPFDLGLFSTGSSQAVVGEHWRALAQATGAVGVLHAPQTHGTVVHWHTEAASDLSLTAPGDGHATASPGLLLTVSVADCVPVFVVDPVRRAIALLHAGWRGVARGILAEGVAVLRRTAGTLPGDLWVHLGPAICGECYEVGPEVFQALGLPVPAAPHPVDVRAVLARQAMSLGVPPHQVTTSALCTRCSEVAFFSHRGGDAGRQVGYLAIAPHSDDPSRNHR